MVDFILNDKEARVLGALLEKSLATPEYYPLTLNSLTIACNQKSNRNPVVAYDETIVADAVAGLLDKQLVVRSDVGRVTKYAECFVGNAKLLIREAAVLGLLLLRGPQTAGELRSRSERLYRFDDLAAVNKTLDDLIEMGLADKLPRQPGRKESRFTHLLGEKSDGIAAVSESAAVENSGQREEQVIGRVEELAAEVASLKEELHSLRQQFLDFRSQFE
ncbi:MAG: YceH family protein [Desulfurivibrionaceae bacterium]